MKSEKKLDDAKKCPYRNSECPIDYPKSKEKKQECFHIIEEGLWRYYLCLKCGEQIERKVPEPQEQEVDWNKIDLAIEKALSAPLPQVAIHYLIDKVVKNGPPKVF